MVVAWMVDEIAHNGGAHPVWVLLLWTHVADDSVSGHVFESVRGHLALVDEEHRVGPINLSWNTLG